MRRHKYIFLPLAELTGAMRTAIIARLKDYGRNPNAMFKQDAVDTLAIYKDLNGNRYVVLSFLVKPDFIPARFRELATDFNKIMTHMEALAFVRGSKVEQPKPL